MQKVWEEAGDSHEDANHKVACFNDDFLLRDRAEPYVFLAA